MHNFSTLLADILLFTILQISGVSLDVNIRLQLAGLGGAILAVRTIDRKMSVLDSVKIAFSGLVLSNFAGYAFCEYQNISLSSFKAAFVVFGFGIFSDVILRMLAAAGRVLVQRTTELTESTIDSLKRFFTIKHKL